MSPYSRASRCDDSPGETNDTRHFRGPDSEHWRCRERFVSTAKDFDVPFASVLKEAAKHYKHIALDEEILGGTPRIAGTRVPVYMILDAIEFYGDLQSALKSYPQLSLEQVKDAVSFAGEVLEHAVEY